MRIRRQERKWFMMSTTPRRNLLAVALVGALALAANVARAGEIDHYAPGVPSIRDFAICPTPAFTAWPISGKRG
jgi:hypothetical protein